MKKENDVRMYMKTRHTSWKLTEKRIKLSEALPLKTPFLVIIDTANVCNFKCTFCFQSLDGDTLKSMNFKPKIMDIELFKKAIDDLTGFPDKVKRLYLFAHGESLLNKNLPEMIAYAKSRDVAHVIQITTNGSLLTPELNMKLINAGLDELRISIEGLTAEKYESVAGVRIDYERFIDNIRHFYDNRGGCKLYIKAINLAFDTTEDEVRFYEMFNGIADNVSIEYFTPYYKNVDYSALDYDETKGILGTTPREIDICPKLFYHLYVTPNGNVPMCNADNMEENLVGNITESSLTEIWNGAKFNEIRRLHLMRKRRENKFCAECVSITNCTMEEDILDDDAERLLPLFK